jgi:IS5 family transposase
MERVWSTINAADSTASKRVVAQELHAQVNTLGVAWVRKHGDSYSVARYAHLLVLHPLIEGRSGVADGTKGTHTMG